MPPLNRQHTRTHTDLLSVLDVTWLHDPSLAASCTPRSDPCFGSSKVPQAQPTHCVLLG
eukprot:m.132797 g.132797  ORF g.132797 m.132797 type:complete len:59 (+) comp22472_c0_seq1:3532-3708(+)